MTIIFASVPWTCCDWACCVLPWLRGRMSSWDAPIHANIHYTVKDLSAVSGTLYRMNRF